MTDFHREQNILRFVLFSLICFIFFYLPHFGGCKNNLYISTQQMIPLHIYNRHMYRLAVNLRGCRYAGTLHRHIYRPKKMIKTCFLEMLNVFYD